jgi:hypothetical protein
LPISTFIDLALQNPSYYRAMFTEGRVAVLPLGLGDAGGVRTEFAADSSLEQARFGSLFTGFLQIPSSRLLKWF